MKTGGLPDFVRYALCLAGMLLFTLAGATKIGLFAGSMFDSYALIVVAIVLFLIGFYSPRHGFDGLRGRDNSGEDSTPGMGQRKRGYFGDGPFDSGGGGGGGE